MWFWIQLNHGMEDQPAVPSPEQGHYIMILHILEGMKSDFAAFWQKGYNYKNMCDKI